MCELVAAARFCKHSSPRAAFLLHLFVNRRPIENRGLNHALIEGYHNALMKGRFPVCCLFLEIDPAEVDVSVRSGLVTLAGHLDRRSTCDIVVAFTKATPGVVDVVDKLDCDIDDRDAASPLRR